MGELLIFAIISTPFVAIFTSGYSVRREASTALVELESKKYVDDGRRKRLASSAILNFSASCCVFLSWAGVSNRAAVHTLQYALLLQLRQVTADGAAAGVQPRGQLLHGDGVVLAEV